MEGSKIVIRPAVPGDGEALVKIYAPYVESTAISFEYQVPSVEEFTERIKKVLERYPYLVAEVDGEIAGYAYAAALKPRDAYIYSVETTIYLKQSMKKMGIGRRLYQAMEKVLRAQNVTNMNACIAIPPEGDTDGYVDKNSMDFHEHLGFKLIGRFQKCGHKFNRWYDVIWMEKIIGEHRENQPEFIPFRNVKGILG